MLFQELGKLKRSSIMTSIVLMAMGIVMVICPDRYTGAVVSAIVVTVRLSDAAPLFPHLSTAYTR